MFKKIKKSNFFLSLVATGLYFYASLIHKTCKVEFRFSKKAMDLFDTKTQIITYCWHGRILALVNLIHYFGEFTAIVSSHGDGELIAKVLGKFGHKAARGSSRKNSMKALKEVIAAIKSGSSIVYTPDGPRGPRFQVKGSIASLAKRYDLAMIPVSYSATRCKVLNTWDRFLVPIPFLSKIVVEIGDPLTKHNSSLDDKDLEKSLNDIMRRLDKESNLKIEK